MSDLFVDNIKHQSSQGSGTITIGASGEKVVLPVTNSQLRFIASTTSQTTLASQNVFYKTTWNEQLIDILMSFHQLIIDLQQVKQVLIYFTGHVLLD